MGRSLTARQVWIIGYLTEHPGATIREISEASPVDEARTRESTERMHEFFGNHDRVYVCRTIEYQTAMQSIRQLIDEGYVERMESPTPSGVPYLHYPAGVPTDDPLEKAFAAPSATQVSHG